MGELDDEIPHFTIVEEPDVIPQPLEEVGLLERNPWAGALGCIPEWKIEKESGPDQWEPLLASWTGKGRPPLGRRQRYIERRGFPTLNPPAWMNRPIGGWGKI